MQIELGPNEFIDKRDRLGLFGSDKPEPYTFLSVKKEDLDKDNYVYVPEIRILLSPIKHTYQRSVYTFMIMLGDIGGIYGAIVSIPSFFISHLI